MFALRDFQYRDLNTGATVTVRRGDAITEACLNAHRDPAALIRTKYVSGNEVAAGAAVAPVVAKKRGRPKKYPA